jgi:hypothetical protein
VLSPLTCSGSLEISMTEALSPEATASGRLVTNFQPRTAETAITITIAKTSSGQ